jgi:hypothetical protein
VPAAIATRPGRASLRSTPACRTRTGGPTPLVQWESGAFLPELLDQRTEQLALVSRDLKDPIGDLIEMDRSEGHGLAF